MGVKNEQVKSEKVKDEFYSCDTTLDLNMEVSRETYDQIH